MAEAGWGEQVGLPLHAVPSRLHEGKSGSCGASGVCAQKSHVAVSATLSDQATEPAQFKARNNRLHLLMGGVTENVAIFNLHNSQYIYIRIRRLNTFKQLLQDHIVPKRHM